MLSHIFGGKITDNAVVPDSTGEFCQFGDTRFLEYVELKANTRTLSYQDLKSALDE